VDVLPAVAKDAERCRSGANRNKQYDAKHGQAMYERRCRLDELVGRQPAQRRSGLRDRGDRAALAGSTFDDAVGDVATILRGYA
jgi:hypothetical protein